MTLYITNRDGNGKTSEEGHYHFQGNAFSGNALGNALKVTANGTMNITIATGDYRINSGQGYWYSGWNADATTLTVATADASNPRITTVLVYLDKAAATTPAPANNPGIAKFITVDGVPAASPIAPTDTQIKAATGSNPYTIIANIQVAAKQTAINQANVIDQRIPVGLSPDAVMGTNFVPNVGPAMYPVGSIYINANTATNPATLLGFGTWVQFASGQFLLGQKASSNYSTLGTTGGEEAHVLTISEMPSHRHNIYPYNDDFNNSPGGTPYGTTADGSYNKYTNSVYYTEYAGGGAAHNNMPPYVVVYMWRRTA